MEYFDPIPSYGNKNDRAKDVGSGEIVVVYQASLASARKVIELLRNEGLDAVTLEQPDAIMAHRVPNRMFVRIAVPGDQAPLAESILKKWEENCSQSVTGLTGQLRKHALYSCIITALAALGLLLHFASFATIPSFRPSVASGGIYSNS